MKTIRLGKTDLQVSRVGIGGIPLQRPTEAEAVRVVQHALDLGVTLIDTAAGYGNSEERIGKALIGRREQVILTTKSGHAEKTGARQELERSLERLKTEYIDVWQLHNVSSWEKYEHILGPGGAMEAAQAALQAGQIHHIGLSSHNLDVASKAVASGLFETIQFPFNYITREPADTLVPLAAEHDVGFIAMKPFAGGMLDNAHLSFKYLLQFDNVVADPGIEKIEEIDEIVALVESGDWALTPQEQIEIDRARAELGTQFCRQCGYCLPCPQSIQIPMVMIARKMWKLWPQALFHDPEWWFTQAVMGGKACVECGTCESRCPYGLPIREMIVENVAFFEQVAARG
ncbi:MAG: aldo/keto reductase [Anaerolineae bacterium]|nr:aldo/keto reductase [Anaerolineae bacterium]